MSPTGDAASQLPKKTRFGNWLPDDEEALARYRESIAAAAKDEGIITLSPFVQELSDVVKRDPVLRMYMARSIEEAIAAGYYPSYTNTDLLMVLIDYVTRNSFPFSTSELVGCPLNALLDPIMNMPSGYPLFRSPEFNAAMRNVLNAWCVYLNSAQTGWFSEDALKKIPMDEFQWDPSAPYGGFSSWNDFFIREFKPGARPVADPGNDKIIVSACEATPYNIQHKVKLEDSFWIKSQPYSLQDIFTAERMDLATAYVGGDVYQAFLSAYNYHRWNAPISGTVVDAYNVAGTYYSDTAAVGYDPAGPNESQGYITAVASRAVICIDCDDPAVGTVACVFVGMAEISSCVIEVEIGQHLKKGEELGYFLYGGSTHCLIFKPGVIQSFVPKPPFNFSDPPIHVSAKIATAN